MSLVKTKAQTQSRMSQQKRMIERKRNLIILIEKYLLTLGYIEAVTKIEQQSNISLQNWDTADNVDLYMILVDYQRAHEQMFDKPPKLVKKMDDRSSYDQLRRAAIKQKSINSSIKKQEPQQQLNGKQTPPMHPPSKRIASLNKANFKKKDSVVGDKKQAPKQDSIEIQGNAVLSKDAKKQDDDQSEQKFDIRVLKGIPDYSDVPEYRELAAYLQRDILIENPNVKFTDIIGLDDAKRLIKEAVMLPLKYPDYFTGILEPWRGVLLFGPPGTGKTMLAKSVATQCKTTFFNISASSVVSKWRGESEKLIRVLFQLARFYQPSTIFIDEIDSIMSQRSSSGAQHEGSRRMKTELLIQLDGIVKKRQSVFILAASNIPWDLDIALLRRLQKRILVDLPCEEAREAMVRMHLPPERADNLEYQDIAKRLKGYSGSDIKLVCKQAAMRPLRKLLMKLQQIEVSQQEKGFNNKYKARQAKSQLVPPDPVTMDDIQMALKSTKCSPGLITEKYVKWVNQFGST